MILSDRVHENIFFINDLNNLQATKNYAEE